MADNKGKFTQAFKWTELFSAGGWKIGCSCRARFGGEGVAHGNVVECPKCHTEYRAISHGIRFDVADADSKSW